MNGLEEKNPVSPKRHRRIGFSMCGITGIVYSRDGVSPELELLQRMNRRLTHRGPDDDGYYINGSVGLAMRRLKIIDLEGGHQPISNETGDVWTVFNGEIYNFKELRTNLEAKGHRFKSKTDTEVIVHLYEDHGEAFVSHLRGMFAIALWDEKKQKLLLYRDRLGIKPLHYWIQNGVLAFASEMKSFLELPKVSREISQESVYDYLSFLYVPGAATIYSDIHRLPAAHLLCWPAGQIEIRRYWDLSFEVSPGLTEERWVEELREVLEESVRLHAVSDVPLGSFLSGGVDSSSVTALLARVVGSPIQTYSIGFEDQMFNELPFARLVADRYGTHHHEQILGPRIFEYLPEMLTGFDEPFADSSALPTYLVSRFARTGVTVALSGDGGDELFAGYLWTRKEQWLEQYRRLPGYLRETLNQVLLTRDYRPLREQGILAGLQRFVFDGSQSPLDSFSRRARCFQPWMLDKLFKPGIKELMRSRRILEEKWAQTKSLGVMDHLLYLDSTVYLPDDLLTKVDRMSMAHSLEVRVPLLDHKVVELAARMPFSLKLKGNTTKYILKKAMKDLLPSQILKQRKQGFSIPLHRWFRQELSTLASRLIASEESASAYFFDQTYVRWLLAEHASGRCQFGTQIYALLMFELWLRTERQGAGMESIRPLFAEITA